MDLKQLVFWEKFRPDSLKKEKGKIPIILLPRIRKLIENFNEDEIPMNLLFHSSGGLGKSSLAKILTKNSDFRMLKSTERGVDTIEVIENHCKNYSLPIKKKKVDGNPNGQKVIWLEEFDQTTSTFRIALRSFMEDNKHVIFIATANNLSKINRTEEDKALIGRFNLINFNPETQEETEYLKIQQINYLKAVGKVNKLDMSDEIYEKIMSKSFPNLRISIQLIQEITISGDYDRFLKQNDNLNQNLYEFMLNGDNTLSSNYFYVTENYPREKTEDLLNMLSRSFFKYLLDNRTEIILKDGLKIQKLTTAFNYQYTLTIDPEMHLITYITQLKGLLK